MSRSLLILALGAALALPVAAKGIVEVKFVEPEKFSDIGRGAYDRENALKALGDFVRGFDKELPDGQTLKLDVLNIDLAGTIEPVARGDLRVMRGRADWPHVTFRYTLLSGPEGSTIKAGKADLADMNYLQNMRRANLIQAPYGYEKRMLQEWFRDTLIAPASHH